MNTKKMFAMGAAAVALVMGSSAMAADVDTVSATGNASATVVQPLTISESTGLAFGAIVLPSSGNATLTISTANAKTYSTGAKPGSQTGTVSRGAFAITGQGNFTFAYGLPSSITLAGATTSAETLTVSSLTFADGTGTLTPSSGSATSALSSGSQTLYVGGTLTVPSTGASAQAYAGTYQVTVAYN